MLQLEEALARILEAIPPAALERVPLPLADGRVSAERVRATTDLPRFDNSSMDGYAVRASDVAEAGPETAVVLRLVGRVAAGEHFPGSMRSGECVRLFTGSPLPQGADAVVMQEDTRESRPGALEIQILARVQQGENVRSRGEDVRTGDVLVGLGETLMPGHLGLMAAAGVQELSVGSRPRVAVLATGSELKEPGQPLGPGEIYESNRPAIAALCRLAGALPRVFPIVPDSADATRSALASALETCDMVVSCGGVSVGDLDFVKSAFEGIGGALAFWRIAIKPGKPFVFGRLSNQFLFGLPGNPVSALVTFHLLVRPAIRRWQGAKNVSPHAVGGITTGPLENPGDRRHFFRVQLDAAGQVRATGMQASHVLSSLAAANGLVEVPPRTTVQPGSPVKVILWS